MPIPPLRFNCVSDCFKQNGTPINVDIHNETQPPNHLENNLTAIVNILVPLIEKIVIEYIDKRFPTQKIINTHVKEPLDEDH
jgi:hypothetical protein